MGWKGDPHLNPLHLLSYVVIFGGFFLLAGAWNVLYKAQRTHTLAMTGPYASLRHPQYMGFILIMAGFLLQWPTLLTLLMFPVLVVMYVKLAHREEREVRAEFGEDYARYAANLNGYDLRQLAVLHVGQGQEMRPTSWNAPSGGHHRSGTLSFSATFADGTSVMKTDTHIIKLIIRNVGGIAERTFLWTL